MNSMKKIIIMLFISLSCYGQNDYVLKNRNTPIIEAVINGATVNMLIDTGASVNIINSESVYKFKGAKLYGEKHLVTVGSNTRANSLRNIDATVKGRKVSEFISLDLTSLQGSIQSETRIEIDGIIGVNGIKQLGMIIDLSRGIVTIKADTVK